MVQLQQPTVDAIYRHYERKESDRMSRRIGASVLGQECSRRVWYGFRHVGKEAFDGRMLRLFQTGHREELRLIQDLRSIGCTVWDVDPSTGEQYEFTALNGHVVCKLDGVVLGLPEAPETAHALECKSSNKKAFDKLEKEGVEKAKPVHYAQMQLCMGMADLTRAAYFVWCKDDDRLYLERIRYDDKDYKSLLLKAKRIIDANTPPEKISKDPSFFVCKFCPFNELCHGKAIPLANCRTCVHSEPQSNGTWVCTNEQAIAPDCGEHIYIPDLLPWAEPVDGDPTWIKYRIKHNGREFINVADTGFPAQDVPHYASRELQKCHVEAIGESGVEGARKILGGEVVAAW